MESGRSMKNIKVLHLITRLTLGGSAENTVQSLLMLDRAGYDCLLASGPGEAEEVNVIGDARRRGVRVVVVPTLRRAIHPWRDLRALIHLVMLMHRERVTVVHTHTSKAGL